MIGSDGEASPHKPWLALVGIGEDGRDGLSSAARAALAQADLVVGGRRHLALAGPVTAETLVWHTPIEATFSAILARRGRPVCVLASGDPFCFGIGSLLARHVSPRQMICFPQPSAFSLAAARLGWALQDCTLLSLCGRPIETLDAALWPGGRLLVLSAGADTPAQVAERLRHSGYGAARLTICEAMGGPRERLRSASAHAFVLADVDALNTIAVELDGGAAPTRRAMLPGRPDDWFANDGQITRAEIRAVTLSKLAPRPGDLLWDVGAGSGSVGIEWMLAHPANRTLAVERHGDRAARIRHNAGALGTPGLVVVEGEAPASLADLPRPKAVFIGGGATRPGVIEACRDALGPGGRLVINGVTLETQAVLIELFRSLGGGLSAIQLAHADRVGGFHGLRRPWGSRNGPGSSHEGRAVGLGRVMRVAVGVGFRKACSAETLVELVRTALARAAADARWVPACRPVLATIAEKDRPPLRAAAAELGLDLVVLPKSALTGSRDRITIESGAALACLGVPSVAEASALAAAGPGARLLVSRIAVADATCAIATDGPA